jgi:hypothetical protein
MLMMLETSPHGCCHASEPPNKLSGVVPVPLAAACSQSIVISEKLMETCIWRFGDFTANPKVGFKPSN